MKEIKIKAYRSTMDENELRKMVIDFLKKEGMTRQSLANDLGISPSTFRNFLNGTSHLTPIVYKALEEFSIDPYSALEKKRETNRHKTFIEKWMIRNLKNFGNTGVGNLSKKRTPEMVVKEFAKFGIDVRVDENEVVWLKGRE